MRQHGSDSPGFESRDWDNWRTTLRVGAAYCATLVMIILFAAAPGSAASIPVWLDDAVTQWNEENPTNQFEFIGIQDQFVWYSLSAAPEVAPEETPDTSASPDPASEETDDTSASPKIGSKDIRERIYQLVHRNGYINMKDAEFVTTKTPLIPNKPMTKKKCWTRSFVRDVKQASGVKGQSHLSTFICEDGADWVVGFELSL